MTTDICSIWAYDDLKESGALGRLQKDYLYVFVQAYPEALSTDQLVSRFREIHNRAPYRSNCGLGSRITELTTMGFLEKVDQITSDITKKTVNRWKWTGRKTPLPKRIETCTCPHCNGSGSITKEVYYDPVEKQQTFFR